MSLAPLTIFYCNEKDCRKAWGRFTERNFGKWCRRLLRDAGVSVAIEVVETGCWDRCDEAGCLGFAADERFVRLLQVRSSKERERLVVAARRALT